MMMKPRFKAVCLSPILMGLSAILMAISAPKLHAGSKPLGNEVVDGTVNMVTATIDAGPFPDDIAVDPVRNFIYVSTGTSGKGNGEIFAIDTTTDAPVYTLFTGDVPNGMAVSPDGQLLYVTTLANTMQVFSLDLREFLYSKAEHLPGAERVPGGRSDIRLGMDSAGELYIMTKSDGMVRAIVGAASR